MRQPTVDVSWPCSSTGPVSRPGSRARFPLAVFAPTNLPPSQETRQGTPGKTSQDSRYSGHLDPRSGKRARRSDRSQMMLQADGTDVGEQAGLHTPSPTTGSLEQDSRDFHAHYSMKEEIERCGFGTVRHKDGLKVEVKEVVKKRTTIRNEDGLKVEVKEVVKNRKVAMSSAGCCCRCRKCPGLSALSTTSTDLSSFTS